jgi:hypothetical protein
MGTPKRPRKKARGDTPIPEIEIKLPLGLDFLSQLEAEDALSLIEEPQEEEQIITFRHNIPRWDDPTDTTARKIVINTKTKETQQFIQRGGQPEWFLKDRDAKRPAPSPTKRR